MKTENYQMLQNRILLVVMGAVCLFLGIAGLIKGLNGHEKWRMWAGTTGFLIMFSIFAVSVFNAVKKVKKTEEIIAKN